MTGSMLYTKRYPLYDIISTKEFVRIYKLFMQNKANFMRISPENADFSKKQSQFKPNSNPIKPKTNPIQTQSKPICRKGKKKNLFSNMGIS